MKLIQYINSKRSQDQQIENLFEITDNEYEQYMKLKMSESVKPKPMKQKKIREDKGKTRNKYDLSLSRRQRSYMSRANSKKLPFELTQEQFEHMLTLQCIYCLKPADCIDRRDNKQGYTLENSQPCCYTCNSMKLAMPECMFIEHCKRIVDTYGKRP
jgi:hypothetical protein